MTCGISTSITASTIAHLEDFASLVFVNASLVITVSIAPTLPAQELHVGMNRIKISGAFMHARQVIGTETMIPTYKILKKYHARVKTRIQTIQRLTLQKSTEYVMGLVAPCAILHLLEMIAVFVIVGCPIIHSHQQAN